jgi:hypothetical protein
MLLFLLMLWVCGWLLTLSFGLLEFVQSFAEPQDLCDKREGAAHILLSFVWPILWAYWLLEEWDERP